jgi:Flp pilus assembly protein CpaB
VLRRRVVAALVGLVVGLVVLGTVDGARRDRAAWGPTARVAVAVGPLAAGDRITADSVRLLPRPAVVVPDGALRSAPTGRRTRGPVGRGEILTAERLAAPGRGPVAAQLTDDRVAVAVPVPPTGAPVAPGDVVDMWAASDPGGIGSAAVASGGFGDPTARWDGSAPRGAVAGVRRVARRAVVVPANPGAREGAGVSGPASVATGPAVVVAVRPEEAPEVAAASLGGAVVLVVVG